MVWATVHRNSEKQAIAADRGVGGRCLKEEWLEHSSGVETKWRPASISTAEVGVESRREIGHFSRTPRLSSWPKSSLSLVYIINFPNSVLASVLFLSPKFLFNTAAKVILLCVTLYCSSA